MPEILSSNSVEVLSPEEVKKSADFFVKEEDRVSELPEAAKIADFSIIKDMVLAKGAK